MRRRLAVPMSAGHRGRNDLAVGERRLVNEGPMPRLLVGRDRNLNIGHTAIHTIDHLPVLLSRRAGLFLIRPIA